MRYNKIKLASGEHILIGRNSFEEVAKTHSDRIIKVYKTYGFKSDYLKNLPCEIKDPDWIDFQSGTSSNQGILVILKRPNLKHIKNLYEKAGIVFALDGVLDPMNLGSILRIAECFGVTGVIYSTNRSSGITPVVTKASVGASELVDIYEVSNLAQSLLNLKENNWWIASSLCHGDSENVNDFKPLDKMVIVLGAEGSGVSQRIITLSDFKIYIPLVGQIDSINVAQSASIFAYLYGTKK